MKIENKMTLIAMLFSFEKNMYVLCYFEYDLPVDGYNCKYFHIFLGQGIC